MVLDKSFRPLRLEIEITDTMDSEKVLINAVFSSHLKSLFFKVRNHSFKVITM
jgi:hypothetical protein